MAAAAQEPDHDPDHPGLHEGDPLVFDFKTPDKTGERPWQRAAIDGDIVMVRQPKGALYLDLAQKMKTEADNVNALTELIQVIFDADSQALIWERLRDDDDDFDTDELGKVVERLQELWGKGRGGSSKGSPTSSRNRSRRSTARPR